MGMKLSGSVNGVQQFIVDATTNARQALNDQLNLEILVVKKEIFDRMPVDEGNLEDSLTTDTSKSNSWVCYVDESKPDNTGKYTVGDYAGWLNEGQYNLGPKSIEKGADVGPKFMERGFQAAIDGGLLDRCDNAVKQAISDT